MPSFVKALVLVVAVAGALGSAFFVGFVSGEGYAVRNHIHEDESGLQIDRMIGDGEDFIRVSWDGGGATTFSDGDRNKDGILDSRMASGWIGESTHFNMLKADSNYDNEFETASMWVNLSEDEVVNFMMGDTDDDGETDYYSWRIDLPKPRYHIAYRDLNVDGILDEYSQLDEEGKTQAIYVLFHNAWRKASRVEGQSIRGNVATLEDSGETVRFVDGEWVVESEIAE